MRKLRIELVVVGALAAACGAKGGSIHFTASGESLAQTSIGYDFPPANAGDPIFYDGWEVKFSEMIVTFDKVTMSENPDMSANDQSQTGPAVAQLIGPWAVDLAKGGTVTGKSGAPELAADIEAITGENLKGNASFDPSKRYAFGFDAVPASASAKIVNLDAQGKTDYQTMQQNGWVVFYKGTATWKGLHSGGPSACPVGNAGDGTCCYQSDNGSATPYDFDANLPKVVTFAFGFTTPTSYVNCQNPDNDPAKPLSDAEEHERGVQVKSNQSTIAQVTFHTDHPFWESFKHDTPAHFDQLAARAVKQADGSYLVQLSDMKGVDYQSFTDSQGRALPWRICAPIGADVNNLADGAYGFAKPSSATATNMSFDSQFANITENPSGDPKQYMRDYYDYMLYDQSTQGHLNADGLCYVQRHYDSPN